jgi:hypothetical protein
MRKRVQQGSLFETKKAKDGKAKEEPAVLRCFYCNCLISNDILQQDHFPMPKCAGGDTLVPCCTSCHDMKDRFSLKEWPVEWFVVVAAEFPVLRRETKIFLAKCMRIMADLEAMEEKRRKG